MAVELEMISAIVAGAMGGAVGAWRSSHRGTQVSLDQGNKAFADLRLENRELRDRLSKLEGAFELALRLKALRPVDAANPPEAMASQVPPVQTGGS